MRRGCQRKDGPNIYFAGRKAENEEKEGDWEEGCGNRKR